MNLLISLLKSFMGDLMPKMLSWAGSAFKWALGHTRIVLEGLLIILLVVLGWLYHRKAAQLDTFQQEASGLEAGLRQKITYAQNQLEVVTKDLTGKVIIKKVYIPPEGSVTVRVADYQKFMAEYKALLDKLKNAPAEERAKIEQAIKDKLKELGIGDEVIVKTHGWTVRPGLGLDWANQGTKIRADVKFYYWNRWSLLFGGSENGMGPAISRHIDDLIWGKLTNVEVFGGYNVIRFNHSTVISGGLRINL